MYKRFTDRVREGNYGKTAQFWLMYHLDVMAGQHLLQMAIQENNFCLRLHGLKRMLPFVFALNKQNYALCPLLGKLRCYTLWLPRAYSGKKHRLADVKSSNEDYKSNRTSRILSLERHVQRLSHVFFVLSEYVNHFDIDCLYSLSTGVAIDTELVDRILMPERSGKESYSAFLGEQTRVFKQQTSWPISKTIIVTV